MQKRSTESKSESDADLSLGSDEPQSSIVTDHVSDFGGSRYISVPCRFPVMAV
jgi:hypothetical protein